MTNYIPFPSRGWTRRARPRTPFLPLLRLTGDTRRAREARRADRTSHEAHRGHTARSGGLTKHLHAPSRARQTALAAIAAVGCFALPAVAAAPAQAVTWYGPSGSEVCNFDGQCSTDGANYLHNNYTNFGSHDQWGNESDPGGYCVYYETGLVAGTGTSINSEQNYSLYSGWIPPSPISDYQVGTSGGLVDISCGMDSDTSEIDTSDPYCGVTGYWCGGVRWAWLPSGATPWTSSGLTISEEVNPMNSGASAPFIEINSSGEFYTLLCVLINGQTQGDTSQNLELCFVPYGENSSGDGRLSGQFFNEEDAGTTPEQSGPCGSSCAIVPTVRIISTSWDPYNMGTWEADSTQTSAVEEGQFKINISPSQLQTALNNANYWLEVNNGGARCTKSGAIGEGYAQADGQCDYPYGPAASQSLIALEQDGEGQDFEGVGFSQTGLTATTP